MLWLLGIAGSLATILIAHWLSLGKDYAARCSAASTKFRAAVLSALEGLFPHPVKWPDNIDATLRSVFPTIAAAVEEFRPFVPWYSRWLFNRAWFIYRLGPDGREIDQQCYYHYMEFGSNPNPKGTFWKNVEHLLSFANET